MDEEKIYPAGKRRIPGSEALPSPTTAASPVASTQSVRARLLGGFLRAEFEYGLVVDVVGPSRAFQASPQHQRVKFDY